MRRENKSSTSDTEARGSRMSGWLSWWLVAAFPIAIAVGCGGGGGSGSESAPLCEAVFQRSATTPGPNRVWLTGEVVDQDEIVVDVMVGETTSTDLYSFAFDLVLSRPEAARYDDKYEIGSALTPASGQRVEAMLSQVADAVVVGVSKVGGGAGNGVGSGGRRLISLKFRVLGDGVSNVCFARTKVLDSHGTSIGTVQFDNRCAQIGC